MRAGKLRRRITLERLEQVPDGGGGYTETWVALATLWAAVEPLRGNERFQAQQVSNTLTHKVTIRYRAGVTPKMRIVYGSHVFAIEAVIDPEERHERLELLCSEVVQ